MASTAHKTSEELIEHHDTPEVLNKKVDRLAELVRSSKYFVTWTGAGISTSAGIPDFRGPNGKWTLKAQGRDRDPKLKTVSSLAATPTDTHMAMVELLRAGLLKKIISSNTDGLHRRSGVHPRDIAELHGNTNAYRCNKCGKFCYADDRARCAKSAHSHETGYKCPSQGCSGVMCDTIINFGEYLLEDVSRDANSAGSKADLVLTLGSSLRVITCDALEDVQRHRGQLVIVNLQTTPYDDVCSLRIFANCDDVMRLLMRKLSMPIPPYQLNRYCKIDTSVAPSSNNEQIYTWSPVDEAGIPFVYAERIELISNGKAVATAAVSASATSYFNPLRLVVKRDLLPLANIAIRVHFFKTRNVPFCDIPLGKIEDADSPLRHCVLSPDGKSWTVRTIPSLP